MMKQLIISLAAIFFISTAHAQDTDNIADPRAFIERQAEAVLSLDASLQQASDEDVAKLRVEVTERREKLSALIETLRAQQEELQASLAQTEPSPSETIEGETPPEAAADADPAVQAQAALELERTAKIKTLEELISKAERAQRDLDGLAANISTRLQTLDVQANVNERTAEIDAISRRLQEAPGEQILIELRGQLRAIRASAQNDVAPIENSRARLTADLERLGPAPAEGETEAPELATARQTLTMGLVEEDAIVRQSALNISNINQLLTEIAKRRRSLFYSQIFTRGTSPFNGSLLTAATDSATGGLRVLKAKADNWTKAHKADGGAIRAYLMIFAAIIGGFIFFVPARRWINQRMVASLQSLEPTPGRRALAAVLRTITRTGPAILGGFIVFEVLIYQGVIDADTQAFAKAIWIGAMALIVTEAGGVSLLSPNAAGWRLMPLEKQAGFALRALTMSIAFTFFADRAFSKGAATFGGTQEFALIQSAITAVILGALIVFTSQKQYWKLEKDRQDAFSDEIKQLGSIIRNITFLLGAISILAVSIGYIALGYFVTTRIVLISAIFLLGFFVRLIAQGVIQSIAGWFDKKDKILGNEDVSERLIFFWIGVLIDFLIVIAIIPLILMAIGAEWVDVRDGIISAFFGFKVGNVTVSFAQILGAFIALIFVMMATRFIQRVAEKQLFPKTRLDSGVQNSLKTIIGYVGLVIAVMTGISVLGFNLQNLAIIAGALSLGIGFGLQSIVNNFVSGLILLFERPVKVGDWIVVGSGEGTVKRISVRSTEIETFDRSSIIVPNSELISSSVQNWTHKDRWTRITVPIGVSYDAHPQTVLDLLNKVIKSNKRVMRFPEPSVFFAGFGDNSLDFEMRVFLRNTDERVPVQNELRVAVVWEFVQKKPT